MKPSSFLALFMDREEKTFRLGRLSIEGDLIEFEPEEALSFDAGRRDRIAVGIHYSFVEATEDKEETHIRLTAHVDGQPAHTEETVIHDNPLFDDSRRGFLSVPIRVAGAGELRGRFTLETRYGSGPWRKPVTVHAHGRHDGEFTLRVQ